MGRIRRASAMCMVVIGGSLAVTWAVVAAPVAGACTCVAFTDSQAFTEATAVFTGTVAEEHRRESAGTVRLVFAVDRVFQGNVYEHQSVVTSAHGSSCGLELDGPGPFLVFAYGAAGLPQEEPVEGELTSGLCSGSRPLADGAVPVSFGPGDDPIAGSSPIGGHDDGSLLVAGAVGAGAAVFIAAVTVVGVRRRRGSRPSGQ